MNPEHPPNDPNAFASGSPVDPTIDPLLAVLEGMERAFRAVEVDPGGSFQEFAGSRLSIKTKDARVIPFKLNGMQRSYEAKKHLAVARGAKPWYIVLKYRQGGITTFEQAVSYRRVVTQRHQNVITFAQTREKTAEIFEIVRRFYEKDPHAPVRRGVGNAHFLDFPILGSKFSITTAGSASGGRGGTYQRVHWSEVAHSCKGPDQLEKQREVLVGFQEACALGEIVLESTPYGAELFRLLYMEAKQGKNDYTPIFIPWYDDDQNAIACADPDEEKAVMTSLDQKEAALVELHKLTAAQIKWRRAKIRAVGPLFKQEHPEDDESCFLLTGSCYFNQEFILGLLDLIPDYLDAGYSGPTAVAHVPGGYAVCWEERNPSEKYVIAADTSLGQRDSDPCGFGVVKHSTGEQVYAEHGLFTPEQLAVRLVAASARYNGAIVGVERDGTGHAVLERLKMLKFWGRARVYHAEDDKAGWNTNGQTRPVMLDQLAQVLYNADIPIRDRQLLSECLTFNKQKDGGFAADSGSFDDCVMKWAIAYEIRRRTSGGRRGVVVL